MSQQEWNGDLSEPLVAAYNGEKPPTCAPYAKGEIESFRRFGHDKYTLLRVGPFADLYSKVALEKLNKFSEAGVNTGGPFTPEQESDILASCEVLNGKLSLSYGSTLLFNSRVLEKLGQGREEEVKDTARSIMKADAGLWGVGVEEKDAADACRRALELDGVASSSQVMAKYGDWYEMVKDAEKQQSKDAEKHEEGKTKRDVAIEQAGEVMDRVVLYGKDGECDWDGCRGELAEVYERGGMKAFAAKVRIN
jgi:hypothetical protein